MEDWKIEVINALQEVVKYDYDFEKGYAKKPLTELICQLFDDTGLSDLLETGIVFTEKIDSLFIELSKNVNQLNMEIPSKKIIHSDTWIKVKQLAISILNEIDKA